MKRTFLTQPKSFKQNSLVTDSGAMMKEIPW